MAKAVKKKKKVVNEKHPDKTEQWQNLFALIEKKLKK
jgi:hypothetical protein